FGRTVTVKVKFADFRQVTRSRSFSSFVARHDLLRQAGVELVRTLLPTAKGIRLLGVTVSNFDERPAGVADELPLFACEAVIAAPPDTVPAVPVTGGLWWRTAPAAQTFRSMVAACPNGLGIA